MEAPVEFKVPEKDRDLTAVTSSEEKPILLFDGICHLCAGSVQFVIKRDPLQRFRFARLQSPTAQKLLVKHNITDFNLDSVVLIHNGRAYRKSRAALRTLLLLNRAWPLLGAFLLIPSVIADPIYDYIGRHRYRWFGRMDTCWVPATDHYWRFLDAADDLDQ
jgi:predicted DCC family thiol-disulfide oxidoreductase YuxK